MIFGRSGSEDAMKNIKGWVVFLVLLGSIFLTYSNSLHSPFMMDDHQIFSDVKLKNIKFLLNSFIYSSPNTGHGESFFGSNLYYRPMAYVISMLTYLAFGNEPLGYHLFNLLLFTLMCFMLYVFIVTVFKDKVLALVTSVLFALHPVNVFYVNYITSGIHSVRFIFMFLSLIIFVKSLEGGRKGLLYLLGVLCFAMALLCHETSLVLPLYILFTFIFVSGKNFREAVSAVWPYFLVAALFLSFRFLYTHAPVNMTAGEGGVILRHLALFTAAFSKLIYLYMTKLMLPDFILFAWNVQLTDKFTFIWIGGLVLLFAGWHRLLKAGVRRVPFFCATWMMLGFLPLTVACLSLNLGLIVEPQWLSFSSVGFFLFIAWAGLELYGRSNKWLIGLIFALVLTGWGVVTRYNNWIWADEIRYLDYWGEILSRDGALAHLNDSLIGSIYFDKKNYYLAAYYFGKVARYGGPADAAAAYSNLGRIDMLQGHLKQAREDLLLSMKHDPNNTAVLNNLALFYMGQSNFSSAKPLLQRVLELDRFSIEARMNLAIIDLKGSHYKEAEQMYKDNLNIVPYEGQSLLGLVRIYVRSGKTGDVRKYSQELIKHDQDPAILTELGSILAQYGQFPMALDAYSQSIRIDPEYKQSYMEAGKLLANAGMYTEAVRIWRLGQAIDPHDQWFKDNISKAVKL
jgi:tetratricopeptide (TPR) repeat protein